MRRKDVKTIIAYFYGIPAQRRELDQQRAELEDEYIMPLGSRTPEQ